MVAPQVRELVRLISIASMEPKTQGPLLIVLFLTLAVTFTATPTIAAPAVAGANVNADIDHTGNELLPVPAPLRRDRDYDYDDARTVAGLSLIITLLVLLSCAIGPIVALLICFCPQIFPCKKIRNRRPGLGRCDWSDMTNYGYYRNRFGRRQPAPVVVQVNVPVHAHAQPQYVGQNVPLMPPPVIVQQPPHVRGRYQPGIVYALPPQQQQSVYTSPSYPVYPVSEQRQQSYNPNFSS